MQTLLLNFELYISHDMGQAVLVCDTVTCAPGELSEAQKEDMERNQRRVAKQEAELTALRQQLAKLSSIVDKQTAEIGTLNGDIR